MRCGCDGYCGAALALLGVQWHWSTAVVAPVAPIDGFFGDSFCNFAGPSCWQTSRAAATRLLPRRHELLQRHQLLLLRQAPPPPRPPKRLFANGRSLTHVLFLTFRRTLVKMAISQDALLVDSARIKHKDRNNAKRHNTSRKAAEKPTNRRTTRGASTA